MKINSSEIKNLNPINTIAISHIGAYAGIAGAFEPTTVRCRVF